MEVRISRASAVIVQRVPAAAADWFMEWQQGISHAAESFAGYRGTDIFPPADGQRREWVAAIHFDDAKSLGQWLDSPVRAEWVQKLRAKIGDFELKAMPGGFGAWFASLSSGREEAPPASWKMALTVVLGLYPTVMFLRLFPGPYLAPLGVALAMLVSNFLSASILQWGVMPVLNVLLAPWLVANTKQHKALSFGGLFVILVVLSGLALVFHQITG